MLTFSYHNTKNHACHNIVSYGIMSWYGYSYHIIYYLVEKEPICSYHVRVNTDMR